MLSVCGTSLAEMIRVADLIQRPIFILSVQGERIVFEKLNSHYETKVGISTDLVQGKTAGEFLPQRVAETIEKNYRKCIADRHDYRYEEVLDLATGECWWSTTLSPVFDAEGEVAFIIGIAEDITREKTERMRLVEEHATLKQRNADILSFATAAAHDIRPTIGNVQAIIEHVLIGFKDLGDQKIQHLRLAQSIAAKTQDYINEVLGRIVAVENQEPAPELVDVGHIVSDIAAAADPYSKLDISYPRVHVEAESTVLQIVLRNLIDNATRFANTTVRVEVFQSPVRPGQIGIRVTDDGEGFPGGSRAFTSRIRPSDNMEGRTNGFGLRAIQQLTEARGGLFWLGESPDLPGAAFCVSLPGAILRREEGATLRLIEGNRAEAEECPMLAQAAVG